MTETTARAGTARDALQVSSFRRLFIASLASNTGRWMQFATLGILGWELTESSAYLGLLIFAQLAPLGILSLVGGSLADTSNRRTLLISTQTWQMVWTFVLAGLLIDDVIGETTLALLVFVIGLGQGLYAPAFTSILPLVAGEQNLLAAVALNSVQVNGARVVGPAIGGVLASRFGFAEVFALNAATYLAVIGVLWFMRFPQSTAKAASFGDRIFGGVRVAFRAHQVGRPILLMSLFSLLCLPFIGQLPAIAEVNLGMDTQSAEYGWFYATFGLGSLLGAALVGTILLRVPRPTVVRATLLGFAASLAWLAMIRSVSVAYVAVFLVALFYFTLPTTLATFWQEHVDSTVRGRIAALWVLSFGGMVPIANLVAGPIVEATSLGVVRFAGAAAAVVLSFAIRLRTGPVVGEEILG